MRTEARIIALTAAVAAVLSCTKETAGPDAARQEGIRVAAFAPATRALFDAASFAAQGNAVRVWDVYSDSHANPVPSAYIDGAYAVSDGTSSVWPFRTSADGIASDAVTYYWTKEGRHRFYSVLAKDNSVTPALAVPESWTFDTGHRFNVPSTTMDLNSPQLDFVYSGIAERNLDNGDGTAEVPLVYSHLFSAYAFTLRNDSFEDIRIVDVKLKVNKTASASIDYSPVWSTAVLSSDSPAVSVSLSETSPLEGIGGAATDASPYALAHGDYRGGAIDLMRGGDEISSPSDETLAGYDNFILAWPQTLEGKTLEFTLLVNENVELQYYSKRAGGGWDIVYKGEGNGSYDVEDPSLPEDQWRYVYAGMFNGRYDFVSSSPGEYEFMTATGKTDRRIVKNLDLSNVGGVAEWEAGRRYLYNLRYTGLGIDVDVAVMKWDAGADSAHGDSGKHGGSAVFQ